MPNFADIPLFPRAHYEIDVGWQYVEMALKEWDGDNSLLVLDPDYQRAHVWTREQQIAYVEYSLRGGEVGRSIVWNCPSWGYRFDAPIELVDGKQRLEAVRSFMRGDLPAFGHYYPEWKGQMRGVVAGLKFRVCSLETREEVLQLYLNINAGGTPHTAEELDRVRNMLKDCKG
ncbi:MAG: hypothetical protein HC801_11900 [Nitrospira sp.]|nr:hypothetical protein [Nitrospira sp.]